ncbi:hypothetical protein SKAU_G00090900 [Synaphobranchus kaupii]|uniref:Uncharacterized protein n=1 Tax=Synaphobranchus kaupii TaxID=118154 RepID=A0A9Q1J5E1_SYNKA|nr:hypothetical protein SKAU_G00090900 [Synaphobranchus kaupii]
MATDSSPAMRISISSRIGWQPGSLSLSGRCGNWLGFSNYPTPPPPPPISTVGKRGQLGSGAQALEQLTAVILNPEYSEREPDTDPGSLLMGIPAANEIEAEEMLAGQNRPGFPEEAFAPAGSAELPLVKCGPFRVHLSSGGPSCTAR